MLKQNVNSIKVFTDGSCKTKIGYKPICGYGIHFIDLNIPDISKPFTHEPLTNQRTELYAIYKAIKVIERNYIFNKLEIYTDSEYSINSLTKWIGKWKKNSWKTSKNRPVLNTDIIKRIDKKLELYVGKIKFTHVKSHTGNNDFVSIHNDIADKLARDGAR